MEHLLFWLTGIERVWARGGGGGSHGGGSFSGGGHSIGTGSSGSGSSGNGSSVDIFIFILLIYLLIRYFLARQKKANYKALLPEELADDPLAQRAAVVFYRFQEMWSNFRIENLQGDITDAYYRRMNLELNVLYAMHRQDSVKNPKLLKVHIASSNMAEDGRFTATIRAVAEDTLINTLDGTVLYVDNNPFTEYWHFLNIDGLWKLDLITQATEEAASVSPQIRQFAENNGFFFDPDFGWLMLPQKGAIFEVSDFKNSDINNHVIGLYQEKIVEFYSFIPVSGKGEYLVAQAVVPSQYRDILVTRKGFWNRPPHGMVTRTLESPDFNAKYSLFADPLDQYSAWRLLTPLFMEKITDLSFKINIEVIDNFVYFYTQDPNVRYDQMLEILAWAFDAMK